jgi:hypothetical protein
MGVAVVENVVGESVWVSVSRECAEETMSGVSPIDPVPENKRISALLSQL